MQKSLLWVALSASLVGCANLEPELPTANSQIPGQWESNNNSVEISQLHWNQIFSSPLIHQDIELALYMNKNIIQASQNALRAHQLIGTVPNPLNLSVSANSELEGSFQDCCISNHGNYGLLSLDYELDIWGRIALATKSSELSAEAATFNIQEIQNVIVSEIIKSHLTIAFANEYLKILDEMSVLLSSLINQTKNREKEGLNTSSDLSRLMLKKTNLLTIQNQTNQRKESAINALQILTSYSKQTHQYAQSLNEINVNYETIPPNTSSAILLNRPDIRAAEKKLEAANANIGVARADRFPKITLSAEALLYSGGNALWNLFPSISQTIFDGGRKQSIEKVTTTSRDIALTEYEITIQQAFKSVADSLTNERLINKQITLSLESQKFAEQAYNRVSLRKDSGLDTLSNLIDRYEELLITNTQIPLSQYNKRINQVNLFYAIGTSN